MVEHQVIQGRGSAENPRNRFVALDVIRDADADVEESPAPSTIFLKDTTRKVIARNDSPDVGFEFSINPYRGCEHGCIYCYARPTHEWLGFSAGLDFETRILVKEDAPELLRAELADAKWEPRVISVSGVTDCYQPVERKLKLTRRCLEVLLEFGNPATVITKNALVCRDIDLLSQLAAKQAAAAFVSITTLDRDLQRVMEPRTSTPENRLAAIRALSSAGIPTGVMVAPVIPGLTDHEVPGILAASAAAGACTAGYVPLRLPYGVADLFETWLERHFPDRKDKVFHRIRELRGGNLNDPKFGSRMRGEGIWATQMKTMFDLAKRKAGLDQPLPEISTAAFRRPAGPQMTLW